MAAPHICGISYVVANFGGGFYMPLSGKKMKALFEKRGYMVVPGQGKGSHFKLKKKGRPTITIPNHKELKKVMESALLKALKGE